MLRVMRAGRIPVLLCLLLAACGDPPSSPSAPRRGIGPGELPAPAGEQPRGGPITAAAVAAATPARRVAAAARERVGVTLTYDGSYVKLAYPGGDVPDDRGVCTDVVVRAFRAAGVDLQQLVHEDMRRDFAAYPGLCEATRPDRNIDHRRVPNLVCFFRRQGVAEVVDDDALRPGDVVAWKLGNGRDHVGVVSDRRAASGRWLIAHNIGRGTQLEDVIDAWQVVGRYRYFPD